nr:reverse transcriptase domain-containing protein [Tanacetum cinerariifolium]
MEGYKIKDLKLKEFNRIQEMFDRAFRRVNTFEDFKSEFVKGKERRVEEKLEQEITKKQKVEDDKEKAELKQLMETIPNEEEVAIDAIPLVVKEDLEDLYKLVKARYGSTRPLKSMDYLLWSDMKIMFEPHVEDEVWKMQQGYKVLEWKLYDSYGVHSLMMQFMQIYVLVEMKYPLIPPTLSIMLEKKLQIDYKSEMAYQLCKLIKIQLKNKMADPIDGGGPEGQDDREATLPFLAKEHIKGHVFALKSIIKDHNQRNQTNLIRLDFQLEDTETKDDRIMKGNEVVNDDLRKPSKEALKMPLTHKIIEFTSPKYKIPTNIKLYDANSIDEWSDLREAFAAIYSVRMACFKEPHEITKIVRRANESLMVFKERCTVETGFIMGVPEVMKISSFMDSIKSPELAKRFSNKVPTLVNEMMTREATEAWMDTPITFPPISSEDVFDKPLIVEAKVEGYFVRGVDSDRLGGVHMGNIKADGKDRTRRLKMLQAIPSTIHFMMKFPTSKRVATLVTEIVIITECSLLEKKHMVEESSKGEKEVRMAEDV